MLFFSVIDRNDRKKLSYFGQSARKYKLMNTVMASFNTIVRQMTEMSQRKNTPFMRYMRKCKLAAK